MTTLTGHVDGPDCYPSNGGGEAATNGYCRLTTGNTRTDVRTTDAIDIDVYEGDLATTPGEESFASESLDKSKITLHETSILTLLRAKRAHHREQTLGGFTSL